MTSPRGWYNWMDWVTWEWIVEEGTSGNADSYSKLTYNTVVKSEISTMCFLETESYDQLIVGGQASTQNASTCLDGPSAIGCFTFWDHVYFDTSFMRVELGNNAVYASCTKRVIQIPTSWSDTSIGVEVNIGTFGIEVDLYAFVVDEDNEPSDGYLVRSGS